MPELPEVETIRRGLQKHLVGHVIQKIAVHLPRIITGDTALLIGGKVKDVRRYGKGLVIDLDNGYSLAVHVKMTGQLIYGQKLVSDKYTHVIFQLDNNTQLFYRDVRQFGWIQIVATDAVLKLPFFTSLGLEPLKDLTLEKLTGLLKSSRAPIKSFLLDQRKIAGVGNIYANDALFLAKIHPLRITSSLTYKEAEMLFDALIEVLENSIRQGGASANNYVNALGEKGAYQNYFLVYGKEGEECRSCAAVLKRMVIAGRGTFYCPECQK